MEDLVKKIFYTGVGLASAATEYIQKTVDELVEKGKISEDEGKKVVEDLEKNIETRKEEFESRVNKVVNAALEKFNLPKLGESDKLEKRVKSLEVKLGLLAKELDSIKGNSPA